MVMPVVSMGAMPAGVQTRAMTGAMAWVMIGEMPTPGIRITPRATNPGGRGVVGDNGIAKGNDGGPANAWG